MRKRGEDKIEWKKRMKGNKKERQRGKETE
jgi:hypothetical protein